MRKALHFLMTATAAAAMVFMVTTTGCGSENTDTTTDDGGPCAADPFSAECKCTKPADCDPLRPENRFKWLCTPAKKCVRTCTKNADCNTAAGESCEDAVCRPAGCGANSDCTNGDECIGGACRAPFTATDVSSCRVLPAAALTVDGSTKTFSVISYGADGKVIAFKGETTWSIDGTGATVAAGVVTGGNADGKYTVKATVNGKDCTSAAGQNYAAADANKQRVVVANLSTQAPVAGAKVVMGAEEVSTDANGVALFNTKANGDAISVFHNNYAYLTMLDVTDNDVVAFLKPPAKAGKFSGSMTARSFDELSDLKGTVHLALYGGSVPGNLIDLQLASLLGELKPTTLDLGSQQATIPLPDGTIIGLGEQMFKTEYNVVAPVGIRTVWGLGGNADFSAITGALGGVISGGTENLNIGEILTKLLPLLGKLQSGVIAGLDAQDGVTTPIGEKMKLDTLLRLKVEAKIPALPTYDGDKKFEGAIVLGGAMYYPQGLVPLGITAGLDGDPTGKDTTNPPDGFVDANDTAITEKGVLSMRLAPMHGGLEGSKYGMVALAASISGLLDAGGTSGLVLSGLVEAGGTFSGKSDVVTKVDFGGRNFMGVPTASIDARTISVSQVAGAVFHRIDIGSDDREWSVYFPAKSGASTVTIPAVPAGFEDRFVKTATATEEPGVIVQSVGFTAGDATPNYAQVLKFDSENMDDLTGRINAFSTRAVAR
jgi:hypothetical protein